MASSYDVGLSTTYPKISDGREIFEKKSLGIMRHEKWARKTDPNRTTNIKLRSAGGK